MTNLTDYDILVSVQSELDKLRKDYNNLTLANLRLIKLLKDCRDELDGEFGIGAANLVEEIDEVLK